jgi:hypothetical protein
VPLTRAQLLMGDTAQGIVLTDQVQGVREASPPDGITISPDGTIHFDSATSKGTVKLNNPTAFNGYVWPNTVGSQGQQLEIDGSGNLFWADADGIDWTMKGQLIVGTGVGPTQDTLLNPPGPDRWILRTNNSTTSGLEWSPLYVEIRPDLQGAAVMPAGTTGQRPPAPVGGWTRYNVNKVQDPNLPAEFLEYYDGNTGLWQQLATWSQVNAITLAGFSNFSAADDGGAFSDIPQSPAFATRNSLFIPAGYSKMFIATSVAFAWNYNVTGSSQAPFLQLRVDGVGVGYQALNSGVNSPDGLQAAVSVFNYYSNPSLAARTVTATVTKLRPEKVTANDSNLLVFAWRNIT